MAVRSSSSPLWFDPQKHPDKQVLFDSMLGDEMETTRAGIFNPFRACIATQAAWRVCLYKTFDRSEGEDGEVEDFSDEV
jgi:hypothetical protein